MLLVVCTVSRGGEGWGSGGKAMHLGEAQKPTSVS